ncbi:MAG: signal peptidase I [Eubacterium sp.]|nr:signal peptidase I [Eubacterium sp.]
MDDRTNEKIENKSDQKVISSGKRKKKSAGRYAAEFFVKIIITATVIWALCTFVAGVYVIHDNSGYPMIKDGDLCITYKLCDLHENDEIAYMQDDKVKFGRIVAMTGDVVDIRDNQITVNGYNVYESTVYPTTADGSKIQYPYQVPVDAVFVLNDYRDDVNDSRCYGGIPLSRSKGKVVMILRRRGI